MDLCKCGLFHGEESFWAVGQFAVGPETHLQRCRRKHEEPVLPRSAEAARSHKGLNQLIESIGSAFKCLILSLTIAPPDADRLKDERERSHQAPYIGCAGRLGLHNMIEPPVKVRGRQRFVGGQRAVFGIGRSGFVVLEKLIGDDEHVHHVNRRNELFSAPFIFRWGLIRFALGRVVGPSFLVTRFEPRFVCAGNNLIDRQRGGDRRVIGFILGTRWRDLARMPPLQVVAFGSFSRGNQTLIGAAPEVRKKRSAEAVLFAEPRQQTRLQNVEC